MMKRGLLGIALIVSMALTGCGITPPPIPSGERVPINHIPGQWSPSDNLKELHETPQEKAERIRVERLKAREAEVKRIQEEEQRLREAERKAAMRASPAALAVPTPVENTADKVAEVVNKADNKSQHDKADKQNMQKK